MSGFDVTSMVAKLEEHRRGLRRKAFRAVTAAAEYVLAEADKVVPIEEGTLQNSGTTAVQDQDGVIVGAIGFGLGAAAPYAVPQHERLDYQHDHGRSAKYLELPLVRARTTVPQIVAREMNR